MPIQTIPSDAIASRYYSIIQEWEGRWDSANRGWCIVEANEGRKEIVFVYKDNRTITINVSVGSPNSLQSRYAEVYYGMLLKLSFLPNSFEIYTLL